MDRVRQERRRSRRASARRTGQKAFYDGAKAELFLDEGPQLVDAEQGSDLTAQGILIGTRTGNVTANEQVRHLLKNTGRTAGRVPRARQRAHPDHQPLPASTRPRRASARYWEGALLRTGADEIRAAEVRLQDQQPGARRLEAEGSVISLLHPQGHERGTRRRPRWRRARRRWSTRRPSARSPTRARSRSSRGTSRPAAPRPGSC